MALGLSLLIVLVLGVGACSFILLRPATSIAEDSFVYITSNTTSQNVVDELVRSRKLRSPKLALFLMNRYGMDGKLREGRYLISSRMSLVQIVRTLARKSQTPVRLTFNNIRTREELLQTLSEPLELSAQELQTLLRDSAFCASLGCDTLSISSIFIPNTYEVYWNVSAEDLIKKIYRGYLHFWNDERKKQAKALGLTPHEVSIVASIVEEESTHPEEYGTIAGLYLNRWRKNMRLQADPTVKFAVSDFTLKRIKGEHLRVDSPYNTYRYGGLPPGIIRYPESTTLDAVLQSKTHDYLYMCARPDFSGYHDFTASYQQHLINARIYQKKLNERNIQ